MKNAIWTNSGSWPSKRAYTHPWANKGTPLHVPLQTFCFNLNTRIWTVVSFYCIQVNPIIAFEKSINIIICNLQYLFWDQTNILRNHFESKDILIDIILQIREQTWIFWGVRKHINQMTGYKSKFDMQLSLLSEDSQLKINFDRT